MALAKRSNLAPERRAEPAYVRLLIDALDELRQGQREIREAQALHAANDAGQHQEVHDEAVRLRSELSEFRAETRLAHDGANVRMDAHDVVLRGIDVRLRPLDSAVAAGHALTWFGTNATRLLWIGGIIGGALILGWHKVWAWLGY